MSRAAVVVEDAPGQAGSGEIVRRVEEEIRRLAPEATRVFIELGPEG